MNELENPVYKAPVRVLLDTVPPPRRVDLKDVSAPRFVQIPKTPASKASSPLAHFTHFNTEQGLGLSIITSGFLDKRGQLWFGTGGVSRYYEKKFTTVNTADGKLSNPVNVIAEDKKEAMGLLLNP